MLLLRFKPRRVLRGGGLDVGGYANLLDAGKVIREEWRAMPPPLLANCWLKAKLR